MTMSMMISQEKDAEGAQKRGFAALGLGEELWKKVHTLNICSMYGWRSK